MEVTYGRISQSKILETVLSADADKIKTTLEKIDHSAFEVGRLDNPLRQKIFILSGSEAVRRLQSFSDFI